MPPNLPGPCDKTTTSIAAGRRPLSVVVARFVNSLKGISARRLRQRDRVRTHWEYLWSPVVLRCVGGGRPIGDDQGVHPPAAHSGPGRITPPCERRGLPRRS